MALARRLGALALSLVACAAAVPPAAAGQERPPFYEPPATLPGRDGDVIRDEPAVFHLDPLQLIRIDAVVHRIMYRSTDRGGRPIAITGTVLTPKSPWSRAGERPIVAYAVGTQGMDDQCAPSRQLAEGTEYEGPFIGGLLSRGYGVVVTDYQGLGTPGTHTYVNREVQGRAVLDSLRAAQRLPEADLPDAGPVAVTGYSQGGGAAAAAAEIAPTHTPELDLRGVAAGAVPADLHKVAAQVDGGKYAAFLGFAAIGLGAGYGVDLGPFLNDRGRGAFAELERMCTEEAVARYASTKSADLTAGGAPLTEVLAGDPKLSKIVDEQALGRVAPKVPVIVSHSGADEVVPVEVGRALAADWCAKGATVQFVEVPVPTHVGGAIGAYQGVSDWLAARFAGEKAPSNCA